MKKIATLFLSAILVLGASAQKIINDPKAEKRAVSGFHAIRVSGGIDLYLSPGDESVAVSASETKIRDRIKTEVVDGILKIYYDYNSKSNIHFDVEIGNRKMRAYVSYKMLDELTASGGSDIMVEGAIKSEKLSLTMSGGADFDGKVDIADLSVRASGGSDLKISGSATKLGIAVSGGSDFKGYDLAADICDLSASGGSDVYVTVNKELSADASGGSDIYYKGTGMVRDIKSSGSSGVHKTSK